MKKFLSLFVVLALLFVFSTSAMAATLPTATVVDRQVIRYSNGASAEIVTEVYQSVARDNSKSASKTYTYTNASGVTAFAYTLYASFTYSSSSVTSSNPYTSSSIKLSGWKLVDSSAYAFGDSAYANAEFSGPDGTDYPSLSLTCDNWGNVY